MSSESDHGQIVAAYGRQFLVRTERFPNGISCVTRGKRVDYCVGDEVSIQHSGDATAVIEALLPRRNLLMRSDHRRTKIQAANLDQLLIVIASEPPFSENLLGRILIAADRAGIPAALIATKSDLLEASQKIEPRLKLYESLGYPVIRCAPGQDAKFAKAVLAPYLANRQTLLLGQSGMGKSTLVNALVPDAGQTTRQISEVLGTGRHTTTFSKQFTLNYDVDGQIIRGRLIDSPGFQEFGLAHLHRSEIEHAMPEIKPLLGQCRFRDCRHRDESDCAVKAKLASGDIDQQRYDLLMDILSDLDFYSTQH